MGNMHDSSVGKIHIQSDSQIELLNKFYGFVTI
jgi:hypothetical protein